MLPSEGFQTERYLGNSEKFFFENKLESDNKFLLNHVLDVLFLFFFFFTKMAV